VLKAKRGRVIGMDRRADCPLAPARPLPSLSPFAFQQGGAKRWPWSARKRPWLTMSDP
jgi:hypothetical protein